MVIAISSVGKLKVPRKRRTERLAYVYGILMIGLAAVVLVDRHTGVFKDDPADVALSSRYLTAEVAISTNSSSDFPKDLFTMNEKKDGAILLHIICIFYMFYGIALLCDNYFEPALEKICERLNLEEDVAGATFMAAGGSAPELATSLLGVFVSKSDIGIGTIVGSAVFNVLFVIAVCAFCAPNLELTWWPLARDCTYYCISIMVLTFTIFDQEVKYYEAIILLVMYLIYVFIMKHNQFLRVKVEQILAESEKPFHPWRQKMADFMNNNYVEGFIYLVIVINLVTSLGLEDTPTTDWINNVCNYIYIVECLVKVTALGFVGYWRDALNAFDGVLIILILVEMIAVNSNIEEVANIRSARTLRFFRVVRIIRAIRLYRMLAKPKEDATTQTNWAEDVSEEASQMVGETAANLNPKKPLPPVSKNKVAPVVAPAEAEGEKAEKSEGKGEKEKEEEEKVAAPAADTEKTDASAPAEPAAVVEAAGNDDGDFDDDDDDDDDGPFDPFERPESGLGLFVWVMTFPLAFIMYLTIPECQSEKRANSNMFWGTFFLCIGWIAVLSYQMVWMAVEFGLVAGIPEPVMGLTLLAGGTSIPDALSSLAVARRGFGDMAVSSSVGSNIFDILVGLPVPWLLKTAVTEPGSVVVVKSGNLPIMIITLFIMVALVITCIHICHWRLNFKLGYIFMFLYVVFVAESLVLEYDLI